jgi:hypothetical protein
MSEPQHTNALIHETSPYLLQHAHNLVDWHPWSEKALQKARQEDKPILLSIGYSACHWCHVMERESFENEKTAALMNEFFINIKVDREERPDLDAVYMQAVMMIAGNGGWPMTAFLTPDLEPFYGGTYFPPEDRHGMPGFPRVLQGIAQAYRERRTDIRRDAALVAAEMQKDSLVLHGQDELTTNTLDEAVSQLLLNFDEQNGGFGTAPKFPPAMTLDLLMRSYLRTGTRRFLDVTRQTLGSMACGGIYDQLGGGFHRYSVDARWQVPHFEKMLYDNALLSRIYLHGYLLTGEPLYRRIVEETLAYVMREMTSPEGGFYASQDADSEGEEGKFYTWERREVQDLLGGEGAELFCRYFGITDEGGSDGKNTLHIPRSASLVARLNNVGEEKLHQSIERGKKTLLAAREKRARPFRDEKILAFWNGLMLKSFAEAAQALDCAQYRTAAVRCAEFLLSRLKQDGRLRHSYKDGQARIGAFLDDYACVADGFLSLYEATFDPRWIREATELAAVLVDQFKDTGKPGFFMTSQEQESLVFRPKDWFDNATPSGNSAAAHALLRLARFTGDDAWTRPVMPLLQSLSRPMAQNPAAFSNLLCALDFALSGGIEIAIAGNPLDPSSGPLLREVFQRYLPNKVVACGLDEDPVLLKDRKQIADRPTAYVCRNHVCLAPVTVASELAAQL